MEQYYYPAQFFLNESSFFPFPPTSPITIHEDVSSINEDDDCDDQSRSYEDQDDLQVISALLPFKKRRQRPSRRKAFPRIIKQDIRRHYGQMLVNVLNSHDGRTIDAFLDRYAIPSVTLVKHVDGKCIAFNSADPFDQKSFRNLPQTVDITIKGRADISRYWQLLQSVVPDQCIRINNARISRNVQSVTDPNTGKVRLVGDDDTRVICEWEGRATQIYEVSPPCFAYTAMGGRLDDTTDDATSCSTSSLSSLSSDDSARTAKKPRLEETYDYPTQPGLHMFPLKRRAITFEVTLRGRLVMEVDRDFRLKTFDFGNVDVIPNTGFHP